MRFLSSVLFCSKFSELDACTRELCWEIVLNGEYRVSSPRQRKFHVGCYSAELHNHSKFCAGCDIVQQDQNNKRVLRNSTKVVYSVSVLFSLININT